MNKHRFALFLCALSCVCAWSEEPVHFPDPTLKAVVEDALWIADPTPSDMLGLTSLEYNGGWAGEPRIVDLTGLEYATNLQKLTFQHNEFSDLTPLSNLQELRTLIFQWDQIHDLSPLAGMTQLETIDLEANPVVDLSPLSGLTNLSSLSLHRTQICDLSPLVALTSLTMLDVRLTLLDADDYYVYMPQIYANNPGIVISYMRYYDNPQMLTITCSAGGSVTSPGEGEFTYELGETAILSAKADEGFVFLDWSGDYYSQQNQTTLTMNHNYAIHASFVRLSGGDLYVDDDTSGDPSENGTEAHPFDSIQEAIDHADDDTTIFVRPGTYRENIELPGKRVYLTAVDPADPNGGPCAILEGAVAGPVITITGGKHQCGLSGFVITRGTGQEAGAVYCDGANATIVNCLIVGNRTTAADGAAVYCKDSEAILTNCTIADNYGSAGLSLIDSNVTVLNSILWNNQPTEILSTGTSTPDIRYSDVRGGWAGERNLNEDPLFARPGSWADPDDPTEILGPAIAWSVWAGGDYHLASQTGRWDPAQQDWVQDDVTSPCIDAGLASVPVGNEPAPNGSRINRGAYGGTGEASMSPGGF